MWKILLPCSSLSFLPMGHTGSCALAKLHLFKIHFSFLRACQDGGQLHGELICCCTDVAKAGGESPTASIRGRRAFRMHFSRTLSITKQTKTPSREAAGSGVSIDPGCWLRPSQNPGRVRRQLQPSQLPITGLGRKPSLLRNQWFDICCQPPATQPRR